MDGILVVDKPAGMTSHDVVLSVRRRFRQQKVGHAGTLDPMATGVLVLLLGRATKRSSSLMLDDKDYEGIVRLGGRTRTGDSEGEIISTQKVPDLKIDDIRDIFDSFRGAIEQTPPMFSALKFNGKKLYELARRGVEIDRQPRKVAIHDITVKEVRLPDVSFFVSCSKGTYIRALADDIGQKLGCGAHLARLRRIRSGRFSIADAVPFDELMRMDAEGLAKRLT